MIPAVNGYQQIYKGTRHAHARKLYAISLSLAQNAARIQRISQINAVRLNVYLNAVRLNVYLNTAVKIQLIAAYKLYSSKNTAHCSI